MACILPPALNDRDLRAYLDGEAGPGVRLHLERCPHCRAKAERPDDWRGAWLTQLYRHACPSTMELGEYRLDMLAHDRAESVREHLAACPHCIREVAQLEAYLDDLAPDLEVGFIEQIKERTRVVIARLIALGGGNGLLGAPALAPAYAGLRGGEENVHLYEAEEMSVAIEIQDDAAQPGRKAILGLAMGPEPPGGLAFLWQMQRRITVVPVDDLGNFVIPNLDAGSYELILSGPMVEIHIQELQVEMS